ncbi:uncharacterized protein BO88DRAFT_414591 [Aspergillus vadensis CBS 113365]|uniref:Uncharacterized protein n=1 Tax=Aspergillus vadensis (strain CBS 113365 / IMI 142717 / IBT 24658) TaxID=1448311 RepID=A0A319BW82_ASPVC|nr:hypothetical protein BO88DRAFT_414591 [Aspergillus vadensis CBS 113365]PYH70133.1 hypothetical protein BO88DRAFT_414591 [Aspergillus vadensis CBS 113365]
MYENYYPVFLYRNRDSSFNFVKWPKMPKRVKNQSSINDYFKRKQDKIINALDDAGVVVPAGMLPVTRLLTPAQKLRKKELRDELHRLQLLEDEYREEYNKKKEEWTSSRKELVDQLAAHDKEYKTEIEPDEKLLTDDNANIKAIYFQRPRLHEQKTGHVRSIIIDKEQEI